jgi:hypothetical protein
VFRHIVGLALLGLAVVLGIRLALGLFGLVLGLSVTILLLAVAGYLGYTIVLMLSPSTAAKLRRLIDRTERLPAARSQIDNR